MGLNMRTGRRTLEYRFRDMGTNGTEQGRVGWDIGACDHGQDKIPAEWHSDKTTGESTRVFQIIGTTDLRGMENPRPLTQSAGSVRSDQLDSPSADRLEETYDQKSHAV